MNNSFISAVFKIEYLPVDMLCGLCAIYTAQSGILDDHIYWGAMSGTNGKERISAGYAIKYAPESFW